MLTIARQPQGQNGLEPFRTGEVGGHPDCLQGIEDIICVVAGGAAPFLCRGLGEALESPQYPNGMFAVIATHGTELIEDRGFLLSRGLLILQEDRLHIFSF